jgi:hypothetical protein
MRLNDYTDLMMKVSRACEKWCRRSTLDEMLKYLHTNDFVDVSYE